MSHSATHRQEAQKPLPTLSRFIVALAMLTALAPVSIDMYLPAFGDIGVNLHTTASMVQRSLSAYFFGLAFGQLVYGPVADRFGRKAPLYFGLVLYIAASLGCTFARSIDTLIYLRVIQALGGSACMVVSRAMVRDRFDPNHAARVFSLLMLVVGVAPILAPVLGGYITTLLGWRAIFALALFFSIGCFCMALRMPETRPHEMRLKSLSLFSAALSYGRILRDRQFIGYSLASAFAMSGMFAYIAGSPFVLIELYGVAKQHYGLFFGSNAFGLIASAQINSRMVSKWGFYPILKVTTVAIALAGLYLLLAGGMQAQLVWLAPGLFIYVSMIGFINPNAAAGAMANQGGHAGSAAALLGTLQFLSAALSSLVVSFLHNGTAMPMALTMYGCALLSWLSFRYLK